MRQGITTSGEALQSRLEEVAATAEGLRGEIERALVEYKVLFFRDQSISQAEHAAFAKQFGELEVHPFLPEGEAPEVIRFAKDADVVGVENNWHSDVSWREVPSLGSVLRAYEVPTVGGDTLWTDVEAVYEGLPEDLKKEISTLKKLKKTIEASEECQGLEGCNAFFPEVYDYGIVRLRNFQKENS